MSSVNTNPSNDELKRTREAAVQGDILTGVRNGGPAELRRALVYVESGQLSLGTVRGVVKVRLGEALRTHGLNEEVTLSIKAALLQLQKSEEVEVPFFSSEAAEVVRVPFTIDRA